MPRTIDKLPDFTPEGKWLHLDQYLDGQVWVFDFDDAVHEFRHEIKDPRRERVDDLLKRLRGRLAFVARRKGGAYMYNARLHEGELFFVYGPTTCRTYRWCTKPGVDNTGRCADHQHKTPSPDHPTMQGGHR